MRWKDKITLFWVSILLFLLIIKVESPSIKLVLAIAFALFLHILIRRSEEDLKRLLYLLRRIRAGDHSAKFFVDSDDDIGRLFYEVNELSTYIEALSRDLAKRGREIEALLLTVKDPIVLLDGLGRIKKANSAFAKLFGDLSEKSLEGRWYWEILREKGFFDLIDEVRRGEKVDDLTLNIGERFFLVSGSSLGEETLFCLKDITDEVRSRRKESELISNMAHEIKTPLTAIKGAIEAIEDGGDPNRFLAMVKRNVERLTRVASDLLLLQEMDGGRRLEFDDVDLRELTLSVKTIFEEEAKRRGIFIDLDLPKHEVFVKGDRFLLECAFVNLVDNAIKYNVEGGRVRLGLFQGESEVRFVVEDTGIGIPREHIPYIFDKFYVVDRSRSRKLGGAGLGLSIVKDVVSLHGGRVEVQSDLGKGSKFTLVFPL